MYVIFIFLLTGRFSLIQSHICKIWFCQYIVSGLQGNELFKKGAYEAAVERYSVAMELDPTSAVLPANRALALLKLER